MSEKQLPMDRLKLKEELPPLPDLEQQEPLILQQDLLTTETEGTETQSSEGQGNDDQSSMQVNETDDSQAEDSDSDADQDPSNVSTWGFDTTAAPSAMFENGALKSGELDSQTDDALAVETLEMQLLLEGIYKRYGFDFREYSPSSLRRRIWKCLHSENLSTISGLQEKIFHDPVAWKRFLATVTVNVTSMFRDPEFYRALRTLVVPVLEKSPFIRVWHAGCASGEEVYSTAIILHECGLLDRCRIYATDVNEAVLARARNGIYRLEETAKYNDNYILAGGAGTFSDYYQERYGHCIMDGSLREKILFAKHDLVTDGSFNDFNLILCRNVLIYFSKGLQEHVHQLLYKSLSHEGILGLGQKENLRHTQVEECYNSLAEGERLYQKIA